MNFFLKRIGYFFGSIFLLNIFISLFDSLVTYSPSNMKKKIDNLDKQILKNRTKNNNKDSEDMKIIGDIKWTDNLGTWRKRLPLCPMTYEEGISTNQKYFTFPNQYPDGMITDRNGQIIGRKSDDYMKENCTIKIGGLNLQINRTEKFQFKKGGSSIEIDDLMTHFLTRISFKTDSKEDRYLLYKILKDKYNECTHTTRDNCFESQYSQYTVDGDIYSDLSIKTTTKSNKILEELSEQIYRSQIDINRLDPSEF